MLGAMNRDGVGLAANAASAAQLFQKACTGGDAEGCGEMGLAVREGRGVPRDPAKAAALFSKACDGGSMTGCYHLGLAHETGAGAPRDPAKAAALFTRACEAHQPGACHSLGLITKTAARTPADIARAADALQGILRRPFRSGCYEMATAYFGGRGVARDYSQAGMLYRQACNDGDFRGCTSLGRDVFLGRADDAGSRARGEAVPGGLRRRRRERLRAPGSGLRAGAREPSAT